MTTPTKLKLAAYGRASDDAYTPARQAKDMRTWARLNGHTIVGDILFDAGTSRKVGAGDRPGLARALDLVADRTVQGVLVPTLHKLAADLIVQESALGVIWAHGGRVFAVDGGEIPEDDADDPMRTFVRQVMGAAAELEQGLSAKYRRSGQAGCCQHDCTNLQGR